MLIDPGIRAVLDYAAEYGFYVRMQTDRGEQRIAVMNPNSQAYMSIAVHEFNRMEWSALEERLNHNFLTHWQAPEQRARSTGEWFAPTRLLLEPQPGGRPS